MNSPERLDSTARPRDLRQVPAMLVALVLPAFALAQTAPTEEGSDPLLLDEVVVTAAGFEQVIANAPASISVVSQSQLALKPFVTLTDALREMPGVSLSKSKSGDDISLRGMGSDYTLILVDGRRQNSRDTRPNGFGEAETGFIPPLGAIERIELVRGPMSTLYGSDAMGGVINVITRKVGTSWSGAVNLDATLQEESNLGDAWSTSLYLHGPIVQNRLGLALFGRTHNRAEDDLGIAGNSPNRQGARRADVDSFNARLAWTPHVNHELMAEYGVNRQRFEGTPGKTGTMGITTGASAGYDQALRFHRETASLSHTGRWTFGTSDVSVQRESVETRGRRVNLNTPRRLEVENTVLDARLHMPVARHQVTIGGQYQEGEAIDGVVVDGDLSMWQWSAFVEDEWRILDSVGLTLGARVDEHDSAGTHFSPRAYVVWNLTRDLTVKGGISTGFKAPTLTQKVAGISGIGGQGTIPLVGNPDLKPETSRSYELGLYYATPSRFVASATVFFNEFEDKIASVRFEKGTADWPSFIDPADWPRATYASSRINIDTAETRGFEGSIRIPLPRGFAFSTNYTYTDTEQTSGANAGRPLTSMPEHQLNGTLDWKANDRVTGWIRGVWQSSQWRSATQPDFEGYATADLGGSWRVNRAVTVNVGVFNLFNKDLHDPELYASVEDGRRLWVSTNLNF
jgi:outer membrane receptor for ferrienterochelin and colicins